MAEEERKRQERERAEALRQAELEKQRQKVLEIERERERMMQQMLLVKEAEAREAERKRKEEWARQRQAELVQMKKKEQESLQTLRHHHQTIKDQVTQVETNKRTLSQRLAQERDQCTKLAAALDTLKETQSSKHKQLLSLPPLLQVCTSTCTNATDTCTCTCSYGYRRAGTSFWKFLYCKHGLFLHVHNVANN